MRKTFLLFAMIGATTAAHAAQGTFTFVLSQDPGNVPDCIAQAPSFERPFTLTANGSTATLTSAGGININMTSPAPDQYHGVFQLWSERYDYTADLGAAKTLTVVGNNLGCKWVGKAQ